MWTRSHLYAQYISMVNVWREVVKQSIADLDKIDICFSLFAEFVDRMAALRVGQINAPLRFYADMMQLKQLLTPSRTYDELGYIAIRPSFWATSDWLYNHRHADRTQSVGGPIHYDNYLAWEQLRHTICGQQWGHPVLEYSEAHSEYVQSFLRRVVDRPEADR